MWKRIVRFAESATGYKNPLLSSTIAFFILFLVNLSIYQTPLRNPAVSIGFFAFLFFATLWGLSMDRTRRFSEDRFLKSRFKESHVGVFAIRPLSDDDFGKIAAGCAFPPHCWIESLQPQDPHADSIDATQISDDFEVLVNPFGERYLESDTANMRTLKRIKQFVREGGIFVNVGGLAFFYMYNPQTNIEGLTGSMLEFYEQRQFAIGNWNGTIGHTPSTPSTSIVLRPTVNPHETSLIDTWLFRNLGIRTTLGSATIRKIESVHEDFTDIVESNSKVNEFRAIERCEASDAELIPILKSEYQYFHSGTHECYPIAVVHYGLGHFVICGMTVNEKSDKLLIEKTIGKICEILAHRGRLKAPG